MGVWRHILPPQPVRTTPRDMFSGERYPSVIDVSLRNGAWHTVVVINWRDEETWQPDLRLETSLVDGLMDGKTYRVCEFFSGTILEGLKRGDPVPLPPIAPHGSVLLKIEAEDPASPSVVASDVHFSFGAELKRLEVRGDTLWFETDYAFDIPVRYTISLPEGYHCASLPPHCSVINGRLAVCLPGRGHYDIAVPLKRQGQLVPL